MGLTVRAAERGRRLALDGSRAELEELLACFRVASN
jgi:hypothetical protein